MSLTKSFVKSRGVYKVTFELPKEANPENKEVRILGEFNDWSWNQAPSLKKAKGVFKTQLELQPGQKYEFRYLIEGGRWVNDWKADSYIPSPYAYVDNCVVNLEEVTTQKSAPVNFTKIEGVGPKIAELLKKAGFSTYEELAKAKKSTLKSILQEAGKRYQMHDPSTWAKQSKLLAKGKLDELKKLQAELKGGKVK